MKKLLLFVSIILSTLTINAQFQPAGSSVWNDDVAAATSDWSVQDDGTATVGVTTDPTTDTTWNSATSGNGYFYFSSDGTTNGYTGTQSFSMGLNTPIALPDTGKEHLALAFEQYYHRVNSHTFVLISPDGVTWDTIEINKFLPNGATARRFRPLHLPIDHTWDNLHVQFMYKGVSVDSMNAEWIIDDIELVQLPIVRVKYNKFPDICNGDSVILTANPLNTDMAGLSVRWGKPGVPDEIISDTAVIKEPVKLAMRCALGHPGANNYSLQNEVVSIDDSIEIDVKFPYEDEEIFVATYDPVENKNLVVWKKTSDRGTEFYNIYKGPQNNEVFIDQVPYGDRPILLDPTSNPKLKSVRYKITVVDTCGNESFYSSTHATMFLQLHEHNNKIKLSWTEYEGINFDYYYLYRGADTASMVLIDSVEANTVTHYIDENSDYLNDEFNYYVEVRLDEVYYPPLGKKSNSGPFSRSLSNLEDNRQMGTGISSFDGNRVQVDVYPNPFSESFVISYELDQSSKVNLRVVNMLGQKLCEVVNAVQQAGQYRYEIESFSLGDKFGSLLILLQTEKGLLSKKLVHIE